MKKGFTLVELLAVIIILAIVTLIGTVSISSVKVKIDKNMFEKKLDFAIIAARNYGNDNKSKISEKPYVKIGTLISEDYLTTDEEDESEKPSINHYLDGSSINNLEIKTYIQNNRVYACIEKTEDNLKYLQDPDGTEFASLGYYCE